MTRHEWTDDELVTLTTYVKHGMGWLEISKRMNITPDQARMKWRNTYGEMGTSGKMTDPKYIEQNTPKIGLFDLETLPLEGFAWRMWDVNFSADQVISGTGLLSWAGKFLNESEMYSDILTPKEAKVKDDKRITKSCWEFLDKCDIVCGHNLTDFDSRVARTFFLKYDLPPIKYVQIDTLKIAKHNLKMDSNKMAFINKYLGIRQKIETEGFPLWRDCRAGDVDALRRMREYNEGDVLALEELYYKLRPYFPHVFNLALYSEIDKEMCPVCGNTKLESNGYYFTPAGKYESVRCSECKCVSRRKENLLGKDKRKRLLINS